MASINLRGTQQHLASSLNSFKSNVYAKGLPAQRYKKLLLVGKESRLTRWQKKGILMSPYVEKHYKKSM